MPGLRRHVKRALLESVWQAPESNCSPLRASHCADSLFSLCARHEKRPSRHRPDHRFRQPGYAADCAAHPRSRRLLRDRAVPIRRGGLQAHQAEGRHPVRRSGLDLRHRQPARSRHRLHFRGSGARHLLRPDDDVRADGRRRREFRPPGVRPRLRADREGLPAVRGPLGARPAPPGLDEPRRPRHLAAGRLPHLRQVRGRALRHLRRPGPQDVRHHVPPRGDPHAGRRAALAELRPQDRRHRGRLVDARLSRQRDRGDPQEGRHGQGDLRPVGRRRFLRRGGADP